MSDPAADYAARREGWRTMDLDAARRRVDALVPELNRHNYLYHVRNAPEIDDRSYDLLYRELQTLEDRFPALLRADSTSSCHSRPRSPGTSAGGSSSTKWVFVPPTA